MIVALEAAYFHYVVYNMITQRFEVRLTCSEEFDHLHDRIISLLLFLHFFKGNLLNNTSDFFVICIHIYVFCNLPNLSFRVLMKTIFFFN